MPAHIKSMLTATTLGIPVVGGEAVLGTWQAIYLIEHRDRPHSREIALHYVGTRGPRVPRPCWGADPDCATYACRRVTWVPA